MKLIKNSPTSTTVVFSNGTRVLYSYETPVAIENRDGEIISTTTFYSKTTSKHVSDWIGGRKAIRVPQEVISGIIHDLDNREA